MMAMGTVYLVGAGPGDPGLLTLRGREWLEQADVVLYDGLVDESLLRLCPQAELINVSKRPGAERLTQADLNALLVEQARRHGRVVRLKGGDPFLFGRGGEEAEHLAAHGVPFEVAPGVTAGIAAPAYAGIPVTHRDMASSVTFVTGHRDPDEQGELRIARNIPAEGAVVVYMAVGNLDQVVEALYEAGRAGDTPAAMVEWGATPKQRTVTGTLATIGAAAREHEVRPPAVLIAGEVVRLREHIAWYEQRPLVGKRIVVTRSEGRDSRLGDRLTALGAEVLAFPTIAVSPVDPPADVLPLGTYDWLVLTSVNGSRAILDLLDVHGLDARALAGVRICVLGEATALPLKERGLRPDLMATQQSSQDVARTLLAADPDLAGKRLLLPRSDIAPPDLPELLRAHGAEVFEWVAYRTTPPTVSPEQCDELLAFDPNLVVFTSASTARNLSAILGRERMDRLRVTASSAVIGPSTARAALAEGMTVAAQPAMHTLPALVDAIVAWATDASGH